MEPPPHRVHALLARDLPGVSHRVHDAGMGAPGKHDKSFSPKIHDDGRVVVKGVELLLAVFLEKEVGGPFLEIRGPGNSSEKNDRFVEQPVRPLRLHELQPGAGDIRAELTVTQRLMLGSRTQLHLRAPSGATLISEVAGDAADFVPGSTHTFGFSPADIAWVDA